MKDYHYYEKFLIKFKERYPSYQLLTDDYNSWKSGKLRILCPYHGESPARVKSTLFKKGALSPCLKCSEDSCRSSRAGDYQTFKDDANKIHNNFYKYPDNIENFRRSHKVTVTCPLHGDFTVTASRHANDKCKLGCYHCGLLRTAESSMISEDDFKNRLYESSKGNLVLLGNYKGCSKKHSFFCNNCKLSFERSGYTVTRLYKDCPNCQTIWGFNSEKDAELYISEWDGFLKVGITNRNAEDRLLAQQRVTSFNGKLVYKSSRVSGRVVKDLEYNISNTFTNYKVSKENFPDGHTECYHVKDLEAIIGFIEERI